MSKTIAVIGATGAQGTSVVHSFLKDGSWTVRGITRKPNSSNAKSLASQGVDVVTADLDDVGSLVKAFEVSVL